MTAGFYDVNAVPPWDSWVGFSTEETYYRAGQQSPWSGSWVEQYPIERFHADPRRSGHIYIITG